MIKILIFFFLILSSGLMAQEIASDNIYYKGLLEHLKYLEHTDPSRLRHVLYVEQNEITTSKLPTEIDGHQIQYLSSSEIKELTKGRKVLDCVAIRPAVIDGSIIKVNVVNIRISRNRHYYHYGSGDVSSLRFQFNCNTSKLEISEIKH